MSVSSNLHFVSFSYTSTRPQSGEKGGHDEEQQWIANSRSPSKIHDENANDLRVRRESNSSNSPSPCSMPSRTNPTVVVTPTDQHSNAPQSNGFGEGSSFVFPSPPASSPWVAQMFAFQQFLTGMSPDPSNTPTSPLISSAKGALLNNSVFSPTQLLNSGMDPQQLQVFFEKVAHIYKITHIQKS